MKSRTEGSIRRPLEAWNSMSGFCAFSRCCPAQERKAAIQKVTEEKFKCTLCGKHLAKVHWKLPLVVWKNEAHPFLWKAASHANLFNAPGSPKS